MPDTTTASTGFDTAAYNAELDYALRPELYFDDFATVRATAETHNGSSVFFPFLTEMAAAVTPLTEGTDVTPVAVADSGVTVTLAEYGNVVNYTSRWLATSYVPLIPGLANLLGYNAGISMDTVALATVAAGTNVAYGGAATSRVTVAAGHVIDSADVRLAYARLRAAAVQRINGMYRAYIHPDVMYDLKSETGEVGWRAVHNYSAPENILMGSPGYYEGFAFVDSPRTTLRSNAGVGSVVDVYDTYFVGADSIAKAYSTGTHLDGQGLGPQPITVRGPIVDSLFREAPMGWYWFGGYGVYRQEAIRRLESSSSIGLNT
jgi:N4-gp56 family major capsid protein